MPSSVNDEKLKDVVNSCESEKWKDVVAETYSSTNINNYCTLSLYVWMSSKVVMHFRVHVHMTTLHVTMHWVHALRFVFLWPPSLYDRQSHILEANVYYSILFVPSAHVHKQVLIFTCSCGLALSFLLKALAHASLHLDSQIGLRVIQIQIIQDDSIKLCIPRLPTWPHAEIEHKIRKWGMHKLYNSSMICLFNFINGCRTWIHLHM